MQHYTHNLVEDYVFILGAEDPEMLAIRGVLDACSTHVNGGWIITQACVDNGGEAQPVMSHNAYSATLLKDVSHPYQVYYPSEIDGVLGYADEVPMEDRDGIVPVYIESGLIDVDRRHAVIIDHHRPGDPGFNKQPGDYWHGSSLGQLWNFLESLGFTKQQLKEIFPSNRLLIAASDHCPSAAFAGLCPGINVDELRTHRRKVVAQYRNIPVSELSARIDKAIQQILNSPVCELGGYYYRDCKLGEIQELNHAQLELGIPVEYVMLPTPRSPRTKVGLIGSINPELIRLWMKSKQSELVDIYGSPERGYAGGYLRN